MSFAKILNIFNKHGADNKAAQASPDKPSVLSLLHAALSALKQHEDEINRLNVYPVPDGDTGTNMVHTMQTVLTEASKGGDVPLNEMAKTITYGALMGARGNSGVILSQIIRGFCDEIEKHQTLSPEVLTKALKSASDTAYRAVKKPTEGTMLTVIKDMAKAAEAKTLRSASTSEFFEHIVIEGRKSVERTPVLLPILKEAGVVDAGGYGLVIIAQGILASLKGERIDKDIVVGDITKMSVVDEDIHYAYCTEFLLKSDGINLSDLEIKLDHLGDSMLVVGAPELTKIHIHTNDPGKVLQIATDLGTISEVQINNIVEQSEVRNQAIKGNAVKEGAAVGIVAVANGKGISEILVNMGVDKVVSGGQSVNPSTADILGAVDAVPAKEIIILPNNKNIILAAQQVTELTHKRVAVIPTKSIPEALSALMEYNKEASFSENVEAMNGAFYSVKTGEVTYAVRDSNDGKFTKNDFIGLYNADIKTSGKHLLSTTLNLIEHMLDDSDEVVTILVGDQVDEANANELAEVLEDRHPDLELDIHTGGQPIYHFIIGIE